MEIKIGVVMNNPLPDFSDQKIVSLQPIIIDDEELKRIAEHMAKLRSGPQLD